MSADLREMMGLDANNNTTSSEASGSAEKWEQKLKGLEFSEVVPVPQDHKVTQFSVQDLPSNHRILFQGDVELMDYDENRLTIELDSNNCVKGVQFR